MGSSDSPETNLTGTPSAILDFSFSIHIATRIIFLKKSLLLIRFLVHLDTKNMYKWENFETEEMM